MILGLLVRAEYHWGYWVRTPFSSKFQASLPLPPPTTLVGALASSLVKRNLLRDLDGKTVSGEIIFVEIKTGKKRKVDFRSPASILDDALLNASAALSNGRRAFIMDDLNRYVTLLFQEKTQGRRYLPKYRTGAIYCSKIYYPSGIMDIAYLFDYSKLEKIIEGDPVKALIEAGWSIDRIGSKESIVTIRKVSCRKFDESMILRGSTKTRFYFPSRFGKVLEGDYYTEIFWRRGWGRYDEPIFEEYILPGSRSPVTSTEILVEAESYIKLDEDVVIVFPEIRR
ncbi:MAG: type I-A CRISPR-associated protein Cas5a [Candidatus Nezhaarchaeales archaeon]|nr:type I-A CRISPR-associated protein Cas5a [Candidatus Geocrenenecus dongiae]